MWVETSAEGQVACQQGQSVRGFFCRKLACAMQGRAPSGVYENSAIDAAHRMELRLIEINNAFLTPFRANTRLLPAAERRDLG